MAHRVPCAQDTTAGKTEPPSSTKDTVSDGAKAEQAGDHTVVARRLSTSSGLTTGQALGIWLLVVAVFLVVVSRMLKKMRRRPKSGMRTE